MYGQCSASVRFDYGVLTLTTIGYGDLVPYTDTGKIFTIVYVFLGLGVILAFVGVITKTMTKHYAKRVENYIKLAEQTIEKVIEKAVHEIEKL